LYKHQKKYTESELLYQRAILIAENNMGPNHAYVKNVLLSLLDLYQLMNREYDAAKIKTRIEQMNEE